VLKVPLNSNQSITLFYTLYTIVTLHFHIHQAFVLTGVLVGFANISSATHCSCVRPMSDSFQPCWKCHLRQWVLQPIFVSFA